MKKRNAEEKEKQLERFLMNVAETAENALREYWQERDAENRLYATEYVTRRAAAETPPLPHSFIHKKRRYISSKT